MMTRNNSGRSYKLLYLIFAPLAFTLLAAFSDAPLNKGLMVHSLTPNHPDDITVIIDPGHGGDDAGSRTAEITEKDIALSIAKSIQSAGEKMGVKIILTRTADDGVSLEDRLSVVTRTKASMFVSIHVNFNEKNASSSGIEIMVSERNKQFEKSNRIAEKLKAELSLLGALKVNGIKKANYNVLSQNASPAALVELGYLSNKADYNYITNPKNQQAVAEHVMKAIAASLK
jgi:N-acetylmuramoyl-L-alanine amidase